MSSSRKDFLAAASAAGAGFALTGATPSVAPTPTPTPAPTAFARDVAERMRRFDAHLSDAQIDDIARQVDGLDKLGAQLRPKGHGLVNADPPSPQFRVAE